MMKFTPTAILFLALTSASCMSDDVLRDVQLAAVPLELPSGTVAGTSDLSLSFSAPEALEAGRFVLWAVDVLGDSVAIAEVNQGDSLIGSSALPINLADAVDMVITEEELGTLLPTSPSETVLMRGAFPGALSFGNLQEGMFANVSGTASINGKILRATMVGLPELPAGYSYGLSLELHGDEAVEGHDEAVEGQEVVDEGHSDEEEAGEGLFLGHLDAEGHMEMTAEMMLAKGSELAVTIESLQGHEQPSHIIVMRGAMLDPEATSSEPTPSGGHGH